VVQETMSGAYQLDVPLRTDARSGPNWGALVELD
jgi:DNA polymerase I-like protein with 3'-5' exonuclease and polymerase domains